MSDTIKFATLNENGVISNEKELAVDTVKQCPFYIMMLSHYREDGTCKCDDPNEQKMMIAKWGYSKSDFKKAGKLPKATKAKKN